ncbi:MAG: DUF748 domain-containing protein [Thiovulaceae bacterium]|nr:DUF748 domain-containing protein [Sulfurimonadaceae bacterium]
MQKIKKIFFYTAAFYLIIMGLVVPFVLERQLPKILEQSLDAKVSLGAVAINPLNFTLYLSDFSLQNKKGEVLASFDKLICNLEPHSLFGGALHLKEFVLVRPKIFAVYAQDKTINFASILPPKQETPKEEKSDFALPRIVLDRVAIVEGVLDYEDYTVAQKFDFSIENIGFELRDIDTEEFSKNDSKLRLYATLGDGGFLDLQANILGVSPFALEGSVVFEASKLYTQWRYVQEMLNLEVADGKLSFGAEYTLNLEDKNATRIENIRLSLDALRIKPKAEHRDVLNLKNLRVEGGIVKPFMQEAYVQSVSLDSLALKIARDAEGLIDWTGYAKLNTKAGASEQKVNEKPLADEGAKPWHVVLEELRLEKIKVDFEDRAIMPNVTTRLNEFNFYAQNITLAGEEPLSYRLSLKLNETLACEGIGTVVHKEFALEIFTRCSGFDVAHYNPYIEDGARKALKVYDLDLKRATLGFDANLSLKADGNATVVDVKEANVFLDDVALHKKSSGEKLVAWNGFAVRHLALNTKTKEIYLGEAALDGLYAAPKLSANKKLNFEDIAVAHLAKAPHAKEAASQKEEPYRIRVGEFLLQNASVAFEDRTLEQKAKLGIDRINLRVKDIDSKAKTWLTYDLGMRLNKSGTLHAKGSLRHTPLKQKGSLQIKRMGLRGVNPYLQEMSHVKLDEGYVNLQAKMQYEKTLKAPDLRLDGSFAIEEFFLKDARNGSDLLNFSRLGFDALTLEMFPNRLYIDETAVDSFFVNALIDEQKSLNFASLVKNKGDATPKEPHAKEQESEPFPVKIAKVKVQNGSAKFADLSLPIRFMTHIHDVNGMIYSVSNAKGEASSLDITGEVDEYGVTTLKGSLEASNPKNYTDLRFDFKNLELSSASGYSATFAGHKIDEGKLFLGLGYHIVDSQLRGENSIIIKKIKLGEEYEDENVTSLPLGFVIALLEDSEGVIDIDMPVEGNVDAPDFKYGALVWKTLGNLIVKAVASPFTFLSAAMGLDGEELDNAAFEAGAAEILPPEREKLENIAKMLLKRPKIALHIHGTYDEVRDMQALQHQKLLDLVVAKSDRKNIEDKKSALNVDILEDIYEEARDDDKLAVIQEELAKKYKGEAYRIEYLKALVGACASLQNVSQEELRALALQRAEKIRDFFINEKMLSNDKIVVLESKKIASEQHDLIKTEFTIDVKR